MTEFHGKGKVAVIKTRPETVLGDIGRALHLIEYELALPKDRDTVIVITTPLAMWCPGGATTPWQLEGLVRRLKADGYSRLYILCHQPLVGSVLQAEEANKLRYVIDKYRLSHLDLHDPEVEWVTHTPSRPLKVAPQLFPDGIKVPRLLLERNIIHLPALSAHPAMAIAGGMVSTAQLWLGHAHAAALSRVPIADVLADAVALQQELSAGSLTVVDATLVGQGSSLANMRLKEWSLILASTDHVAVDTLGAIILGYPPQEIPALQQAQERGLGISDLAALSILGENLLGPDWNLQPEDKFINTVTGRRQKGAAQLASPQGVGKLLTTLKLQLFWPSGVGRQLARTALETPWGQLFQSYDDGNVRIPERIPKPLLGMLGAAGLGASVFALRHWRRAIELRREG